MLPAINKKRMAEEKKLSQGLEKYTVLRRDHVHKKEDVSVKIYIHHFYNESFQVLYISSSLQMRYKNFPAFENLYTAFFMFAAEDFQLPQLLDVHFNSFKVKVFVWFSCFFFFLED